MMNNNEEKFSLGPWIVENSYSDTCDFEVLDSKGNVIAGEYGIENKANAYLMATSPELYMELKKIDPLNPILFKALGKINE